MKSFNLKKLAMGTALGMAAILGTSEIANAQGRGRDKDRKDEPKQESRADKQQEKIERKRAKIEQDRGWPDQQHQVEWARQNDQNRINQQRQAEYARQQNERYRIEQQRQAELIRQQNERYRIEQQRQAEINRRYNRSGNDRSNGNGYYNGNANANTNRDNRYRVYRNGSYYNTDYRGAELLKQAVNEGYRQGFRAGRSDLDGRRRSSYSNSNIYQSGTYGYQSYVNQGQYQYYFRQGFQRGYQDGANSRYRDQYDNGQYNNGQYNNGQYNNGQYNGYDQQYQYGSSNNGVLSILGTILSQILNIRSY